MHQVIMVAAAIMVISLEPEDKINTHTWPLTGREVNNAEVISLHRDVPQLWYTRHLIGVK